MESAHTCNWVFAFDRPPARNFARTRKIRLTGTLGILVKVAKATILSASEADFIQAGMINQGYRSLLLPIKGVSSFLNCQHKLNKILHDPIGLCFCQTKHSAELNE